MKAFKVSLLAATLLAGASFAANAADLGGPRGSLKDEPMYAPVASWSGLYLGVNAGYAWGNADWYYPYYGTSTSTDLNGAILGGHIGYNKQIGNWVLGIEASLSGSNADGKASCPNMYYECTSELNWLLLAGPRLGYAFDRTMVYATGGYALASVNTSTIPAINGYSKDQDHSGWSIGGGIEHQITPNLVLGAEYVHVELGTETSTVPSYADREITPDLDIVRGRLSYKFGGGYGKSLK